MTAHAVDRCSDVDPGRIERDLHDGAQAILVSVAMHLGAAEDLFDRDPVTARTLLATARAATQTALTELRHLVRGLRPPLLADRGLDGALRALGLDSLVPVDLDVRLDLPLDSALEAAAYFSVLEAVTNAVRHSGTDRVGVSVYDQGAVLFLRVTDHGCGGADPTRGTGLRGIEQRLAPFAGTVRVTNPLGGPTVIEAQVPHPD